MRITIPESICGPWPFERTTVVFCAIPCGWSEPEPLPKEGVSTRSPRLSCTASSRNMTRSGPWAGIWPGRAVRSFCTGIFVPGGKRGLMFPGYGESTDSSTVDAPTVLLSVDSPFPGNINPLFPPGTKIPVQKLRTALPGQIPAQGPDLVMFLELAVQESRGERVETPSFGNGSGSLQPHGIAQKTTVVLSKGHGPQILSGIVILILENDLDPEPLSHVPHSVPAAQILLQGMDIGIEIKPDHLYSLGLQFPDRGDGTRAAADMEQNPGHWATEGRMWTSTLNSS